MLLAHLSDTHFTTGVLAGPPALRGYQALRRIEALDPKPDCALLTGDLVDRGEAAEYDCALELLQTLDVPAHVVPGNHDHAPRMLQALAGTSLVREATDEPGRCYYRVDYPELRLLCCDSSVIGRHDGELGASQLAWLDFQLSQDPAVPVILAMHHHPVPSGIAAMDRLMLSDADALEAILNRHPPLARILVGHLHRTAAAMFARTLVMSAPSTYRQVYLDLSASGRGSYVDEPAGILLHRFEGGTTVTHLAMVQNSGPPVGQI